MRLPPAQFETLVNACMEGDFNPHPFRLDGTVCLAISCDDPMRAVIKLLSAITDNVDDRDEVCDWIKVFEDAREESMGRSTEVFFPNVIWNEADLPDAYLADEEE